MEEIKRETGFTRGPKITVGQVDISNGKPAYFLGAFMENELHYEVLEIGVLPLPEIDESPPHSHNIMTEVTFCITGQLYLMVVDINGAREVVLTEGQYMVVEPGAIIQNPRNEKGTKVLVVKFPSIPGDKDYH